MKTHLQHSFYALMLLLALAVPSLAQATHGSNLTSWNGDGQWVFDPDNELSPSLNGQTITIAGAGQNNGSFKSNQFIGGYDLGPQGFHNILHCPNINTYGNLPGGITWAQGGAAAVLPLAPVNSAYTGPVHVLFVGDSITFNETPVVTPSLQAEYPNASSVDTNDVGVSGSTTADWLPGSTNYQTAVSAGNAAHDTVASLMLGTNDSKVTPLGVAQYDANLTHIVAGLRRDIPSLKYIVLQEQPFIGPAAFASGQFDASSDAALQAYTASYGSIDGAVQGIPGIYGYFQQNTQYLTTGLHPNSLGSYGVVYYWLRGLAPFIQAAGSGPSGDSIVPAHLVMPPNTTQQFSVTGLPSGLTVSSWALSGNAPAGTSLSAAGLLTYGSPVTANMNFQVTAFLSDNSSLSAPFVLSSSSDTGVPDTGAPDTGVFNGTIGPATNAYLAALIKNYGVPAIMICLMIAAWMFVRRLAKSTPR